MKNITKKLISTRLIARVVEGLSTRVGDR